MVIAGLPGAHPDGDRDEHTDRDDAQTPAVPSRRCRGIQIRQVTYECRPASVLILAVLIRREHLRSAVLNREELVSDGLADAAIVVRDEGPEASDDARFPSLPDLLCSVLPTLPKPLLSFLDGEFRIELLGRRRGE